MAGLSGYIVVVELMYQEYTYRTVKTREVYSCQFKLINVLGSFDGNKCCCLIFNYKL